MAQKLEIRRIEYIINSSGKEQFNVSDTYFDGRNETKTAKTDNTNNNMGGG